MPLFRPKNRDLALTSMAIAVQLSGRLEQTPSFSPSLALNQNTDLSLAPTVMTRDLLRSVPLFSSTARDLFLS